ncbi:MAG: gliding motility-associated C-terminal domain-containing protein [Bacteroidia bacterium]
MKKGITYLLFMFLSCSAAKMKAAFTVSAGPDKTACPNQSVTIGGSPTATGGLAPYNYSWSPSTGLSSTSAANPTVIISQTTTYTISVRDANDSIRTDVVTVYLDDFNKFNAGPDVGYCLGQGGPVQIGDPANYANPSTFSWSPVNDLSNPTSPRPYATPTVTTTFTLTITSPSCGTKTDEVTVNIYSITADAGADTTILQGQTISLHASPVNTSYSYWWGGAGSIKYQLTPAPDVFPGSTTTYTLSIVDNNGCISYDTVRVIVTPSEQLFFYNTFSPNGDGDNDTWFIGNIEKFPKNRLDIYNRYGQLLFRKNGYAGEWDGKYFGTELPAGTYFYILDTNADAGKYKGSVTIIR